MVLPTSSTQPDLLLPGVAQRDPAAIKQFVATYSGLIWSMARRFEAEHDAEDAVQEIFLECWKHAARFDPSLTRETTFVAVLARRRLIDRRRRRAARVTASAPIVDEPDPATPVDVLADASTVARALDRLSEEQRAVLLRSVCLGMSHREISEELSMPLGTVKAHARRGLFAIRAAALGGPVPEEP